MRVKGIFTLLIIIFLLVIVFSTANYSKTPEEAVNKTEREILQVVHKETVKDGVVLFFKKKVVNGSTFAAGYIKKSEIGWKWIYGGEHSGYTYQYFPYVKNTPFPLLFGETSNEKVKKIIIEDIKTKKIYTTKMINNKNFRTWFAFLDKNHSLLMRIVSLSEKGDIINSNWVSF